MKWLRQQIRILARRVDRLVKRRGLVEAVKQTVRWSRSRVTVAGLDDQTQQILKHESVILVVNHPREYEILALISVLPARRTITILISSMFFGLSKALDNYLIPIYIWNNVREFKLNILCRLIGQLIPTQHLSREEEKRLNLLSLKFASARLRAGHLVLIAPDRRSRTGRWLPGIGRVLTQARRRVFVAMVHVGGISVWDYLRFIPFLGRYLPRIAVRFAQPFLINPAGHDPIELTSELENKYRQWQREWQTIGNKELVEG